MIFKERPVKNKVTYLTEKIADFSTIYIDVRRKENRVLTDSQVLQLPLLETNEWKLRVKSTNRFLEYISKKNCQKQILDIGCGNGWFTNAMAKVTTKNNVVGLDVNPLELEQASNLFKAKNLRFVYGDIFKLDTIFKNQFDIITLNASIQYFPDASILFKRIKRFLKENGEIHIIDSPFYAKNKILEAKRRTENYYTNIGFPKMAENYFHHSTENIKDFEVLYKNKNRILRKFLKLKDSPFKWYKYTKID